MPVAEAFHASQKQALQTCPLGFTPPQLDRPLRLREPGCTVDQEKRPILNPNVPAVQKHGHQAPNVSQVIVPSIFLL
jgi:hypothetical protein